MIATTLDVLSSLLESLHYLTMTLSVFLSVRAFSRKERNEYVFLSLQVFSSYSVAIEVFLTNRCE